MLVRGKVPPAAALLGFWAGWEGFLSEGRVLQGGGTWPWLSSPDLIPSLTWGCSNHCWQNSWRWAMEPPLQGAELFHCRWWGQIPPSPRETAVAAWLPLEVAVACWLPLHLWWPGSSGMDNWQHNPTFVNLQPCRRSLSCLYAQESHSVQCPSIHMRKGVSAIEVNEGWETMQAQLLEGCLQCWWGGGALLKIHKHTYSPAQYAHVQLYILTTTFYLCEILKSVLLLWLCRASELNEKSCAKLGLLLFNLCTFLFAICLLCLLCLTTFINFC